MDAPPETFPPLSGPARVELAHPPTLPRADAGHRERDVRIESQPDFALALTQQMRAQRERLPLGALDAPVRARCEVSYAQGDSLVTGSTFGREMVYAIAHAFITTPSFPSWPG